MKKLIVALLLFSGSLFAQETRNLGDFSTVKVFDQIHVLMVKSNENKIVISGHDSQDVEVVNKKDEVKIRMKFSKLLQGDDISVTLYYKYVDQVEASEGAYVSSEDTFKAVAFELNAKEGAQIKLNLDVDKLKSKIKSGAILTINGKASNHDVSINSGGILNSKDLNTAQTSVSITAGGEADVFATDFVDAKTTGGGDIDIYGDPKQVNKTNNIGGNINVM
ncbi:chaperonin [Flavobacterium beibuense F44-8]|uniref:Chaperonin n=1 Tax=Flavobacterium beibuense F44-8 TaxID=1406840 RepID=A0A0A2M4S2_9FLAO|nr:head GIN domain-containing protein [Flavobacterium beibuense]KGO83330.1 chaperonin [Flavobacterium beibuense F44-8]